MLSTMSSLWAGSWWNRKSRRACTAEATWAASTIVEWPQPFFGTPFFPSYSSGVYWASRHSASAPSMQPRHLAASRVASDSSTSVA